MAAQRVAVFGAGGLLGSHICALYPDSTIPVFRKDCNALRDESVFMKLHDIGAEAVINCIGKVPRAGGLFADKIDANTTVPHVLARVCEKMRLRLIHVSTDCVFHPYSGICFEDSPPNAQDDYALTKQWGEIVHSPHLTVRTSFVGYPDPHGRGLLSWAARFDEGERIGAWGRAVWNGMATPVLADILMGLVDKPGITGLRHLIGPRCTKYDVLEGFVNIFHPGGFLVHEDDPVTTRILATEYNDTPRGTMSIESQIRRLYEKQEVLLQWYRDHKIKINPSP